MQVAATNDGLRLWKGMTKFEIQTNTQSSF